MLSTPTPQPAVKVLPLPATPLLAGQQNLGTLRLPLLLPCLLFPLPGRVPPSCGHQPRSHHVASHKPRGGVFFHALLNALCSHLDFPLPIARDCNYLSKPEALRCGPRPAAVASRGNSLEMQIAPSPPLPESAALGVAPSHRRVFRRPPCDAGVGLRLRTLDRSYLAFCSRTDGTVSECIQSTLPSPGPGAGPDTTNTDE